MKTDNKTLVEALRILAKDIESDDGVANACIEEAANRIEELSNWKSQQLEVLKKWDNVDEYVRKHKSAKIGSFVSDECLRLLKERDFIENRIHKIAQII
jgi:hypothetical protein